MLRHPCLVDGMSCLNELRLNHIRTRNIHQCGFNGRNRGGNERPPGGTSPRNTTSGDANAAPSLTTCLSFFTMN